MQLCDLGCQKEISPFSSHRIAAYQASRGELPNFILWIVPVRLDYHINVSSNIYGADWPGHVGSFIQKPNVHSVNIEIHVHQRKSSDLLWYQYHGSPWFWICISGRSVAGVSAFGAENC